MVRLIATRSYEAHQFWKNYALDCINKNSLNNISIIKVHDIYWVLLCDYNLSKIHYFDLKQDIIYDLKENELLSFIDQKAKLQNRNPSVQEHVEIILNLLCKKVKTDYFSGLRMKAVDRDLLEFVDKKIYIEEYRYVIKYLEST